MFPARRFHNAGILWIGSLCAGLVLILGFYSLGRWMRQTGVLEPSDHLHGIEIDPPRPAVGFT